MGEVLNTRAISSLPLNGRMFSQLVQTVPGAVATGFGSAPGAAPGAGASGSITASVNGLPWGGTTYTLGGVSNMELLNAFINVTPALDSLQEVKVSTSNADATLGTYGGAQVDNYYGNFAPRVGFSYSPHNGKTAVRGAFGFTTFPDNFGAIGGNLERNFPFFQQYYLNQRLPTPPSPKSAFRGCRRSFRSRRRDQ